MNHNTTHDHIERFVMDELSRLSPEPHLGIDPVEVVDDILSSHSLQAMARVLTRRHVSRVRQQKADVADQHVHNEDTSIKVVNLTSHPINLYSRDGTRVIGEIPMSDFVARVDTNVTIDFPVRLELEDGSTIDNIPLLYQEKDVLTELPEPRDGVYYIVSAMVKDTFPEREDLVMVNTTNDRLGCMKDGRGRVIGTRSLRPSSKGIFRMMM